MLALVSGQLQTWLSVGALSVKESLSATGSPVLKKRGSYVPGESPDIAEGRTGNTSPGSVSVPYTSVDISASSSA